MLIKKFSSRLDKVKINTIHIKIDDKHVSFVPVVHFPPFMIIYSRNLHGETWRLNWRIMMKKSK